MVDLFKWMPRLLLNSKNYEASIRVRCLKGAKLIGDDLRISPSSSSSGGCPGLSVEICWKGFRSNGFIGKKVKRNFTTEQAVDRNGVVVWDEEFKQVCSFLGSNPWEVAFVVLKASDTNIAVAGPAFLNLADFVHIENEKELEISVPLTHSSGFDWFVTLSITLKLTKLRANKETPRTYRRSSTFPSPTPLPPSLIKAKSEKEFVYLFRWKSKKARRVESVNDRRVSSGSESSEENCLFDIYSLDETINVLSEDNTEVCDNADKNSFGYGQLTTANTAGRLFYTNTSFKDGDLVNYSNSLYATEDMCPEMPELTLNQSSKLPILKRKMSAKPEKVRGEPLLKNEYRVMGGDDVDSMRRQQHYTYDALPIRGDETEQVNISKFGDIGSFKVGSWEYIQVKSRDGSLMLQTQVFFATIDQRSKKAAGESACTALAVVLAHWLHSNPNLIPNKSELDSLIISGSLEWRNLCKDTALVARFPDKHFDIETIIQANISPISVSTTTGFFKPGEIDHAGLMEFLDDSISFDSLWDEISTNKSDPLIYIFGWNDHFFVLKAEADAFYLIDTLGERLQEGCNKAYVLKFDKETKIRILPDKKFSSSLGSEVVCVGKEACKEYIKSFLAAIPIREVKSNIKEGMREMEPLIERLQIDINLTELR